MIMGHFATALVPLSHAKEIDTKTALTLLVASQFLDFMMFILVMLGVEQLIPANFFDSSFVNLAAKMPITHDVLPVIGWSFLLGITIFLVMRSKFLALASVALVLVHEVCDLIVGFPHNINGPNTMEIGLALYNHAPIFGLILEIALCIFCIWYFVSKTKNTDRELSQPVLIKLSVILIGVTLILMLQSYQSINEVIASLNL